MKKIIVPIAVSLLEIVSGCKDVKLKECIAKTESIEQEFEELCDGDYTSTLESGDDLYHLVKQRDNAWKEAGCDQYQARWVCKCDWDSEYLSSYHHYTKLGYETNEE